MRMRKQAVLVILCMVMIITMAPIQVSAAVKLSAKSITVQVGKSKTIKVTGASRKVKWSVKNKKIAALKKYKSSVKVTGKKAGSTVVTGKVGKKVLKCKVTVKNDVAKAKDAYRKFLGKYPIKIIPEEEWWSVYTDSIEKYGYHVDKFSLYDLTKDGIPELFAYTVINGRNEMIRVYTYKSGKVKLLKTSSGKSLILDNDHTASGGFMSYICTKGHFHNYHEFYAGDVFMSCENIYKLKNGEIKIYSLDYSTCKIYIDLYEGQKNNEINRGKLVK